MGELQEKKIRQQKKELEIKITKKYLPVSNYKIYPAPRLSMVNLLLLLVTDLGMKSQTVPVLLN